MQEPLYYKPTLALASNAPNSVNSMLRSLVAALLHYQGGKGGGAIQHAMAGRAYAPHPQITTYHHDNIQDNG